MIWLVIGAMLTQLLGQIVQHRLELYATCSPSKKCALLVLKRCEVWICSFLRLHPVGSTLPEGFLPVILNELFIFQVDATYWVCTSRLSRVEGVYER